jgi:PQQ-dependent dehydrogenase (s-GDH family)
MMTRSLLAVFAVAAIAAPGLRMRGATQGAPASRTQFAKRVVTTGLVDPFQIVWGPDDYLWVTERTAGRVTRVLPSDGSMTPAIALRDLLTDGPGGLLGMALDPGLLKGTGHDYVYVAYTYDADAEPATVRRRTKIVRLAYDPRTRLLGNPQDVLAGLPAGTDHQGGRLIMGPDRKLYFTIGDMGANQLANFCNANHAQSVPTAAQLQTRDWSLYEGKVLRLNLDGSIPPDNPTIAGVKSHIYSYGHRNPQGLVFAPDGKLYESEHGPNSDDEVNLIRAGGNYGWPHVAGYRVRVEGRALRIVDLHRLSRGAVVGAPAEGERVEPS